MADKPTIPQSGAELFAQWLIEWLKLDADEFDVLFTCLVVQISLAQKHFTNYLNDKYLLKIFDTYSGDEATLETKLVESTRRILIFCTYEQYNIFKNGKIDDVQKKEKIKSEADSLGIDAIKTGLLVIIKSLCEESSNTTEEGHEMPNIIDDFVFDKSCLPKGFDKEEYIKEVKTSIGSIADGDPVYLPAVIGLMIKDGHNVPSNPHFHNEVQEAIKELNSLVRYPDETKDPTKDEVVEKAIEIYKKVYQALKSDDSVKEKIFFQDYALVCREVVLNLGRRYPETPNYEKYIVKEYSDKSFNCSSASSTHGGGSGVVGIELPPLSGSGSGSDEIVPENIRAVATIYMAYQLELLQLIPVADRIVELSMAGLLPYTYDNRMRIIDEYNWSQTDRLNEVARYSQYSRALGVAGGQVTHDVIPNNQFSERLRHAVSSIANFALNYDTQKPLNDRSEYVRKSIRDLAANASYYGWAGTYFVAERLKKHIDDAIAILSLEQIQDAYGVTNMWQVIERVAQREFGMAVNVVKHRTLASEGQYIFDLIADKANLWSNPTGKALFAIENIPGDLDVKETGRVFRASQYILAVEGYGDTQVDQYSQPVATTATPSLPSLGAFSGTGTTPAFDSSKLQEIRDKAVQGQMPNINQILK